MPPYKRNVNMVFQSYALFEHLDIAEQRRLRAASAARSRKDEIKRRVAEALELVSLEPGASSAAPTSSPAASASASRSRGRWSTGPAVLLLDEPLGALDLKLRKQMQVELKQIQREVGITFVYVTHDQEEALSMSDRIAVMNDGASSSAGRPRRSTSARPRSSSPASSASRT